MFARINFALTLPRRLGVLFLLSAACDSSTACGSHPSARSPHQRDPRVPTSEFLAARRGDAHLVLRWHAGGGAAAMFFDDSVWSDGTHEHKVVGGAATSRTLDAPTLHELRQILGSGEFLTFCERPRSQGADYYSALESEHGACDLVGTQLSREAVRLLATLQTR